MAGNPLVGRLFTDSRAAERAYFAKTGIFPIMHAVAIRTDVAEANPWLPEAVFRAYSAAKEQALQRLRAMGWVMISLPWLAQEAEATRELMGENFWPYGVEVNRETLTALLRYSHEQGLTERELSLDELFHPSTRELNEAPWPLDRCTPPMSGNTSGCNCPPDPTDRERADPHGDAQSKRSEAHRTTWLDQRSERYDHRRNALRVSVRPIFGARYSLTSAVADDGRSPDVSDVLAGRRSRTECHLTWGAANGRAQVSCNSRRSAPLRRLRPAEFGNDLVGDSEPALPVLLLGFIVFIGVQARHFLTHDEVDVGSRHPERRSAEPLLEICNAFREGGMAQNWPIDDEASNIVIVLETKSHVECGRGIDRDVST